MKFSIITCTFNSERYLQENINSVRNQTFRDFEHIFIDGFSSDSTVAIIKAYQREFPDCVKLFQFKPQGIADAMNKGIEAASGDYINHLHSDDSFYDNKILSAVMLAIRNHHEPAWLYGKAKFINTNNNTSRVIPHRSIYRKVRYWLLLLTNYIPHQSVFIKRSAFEKYGKFDQQFRNAMDYELWVRLAKNDVCAVFINKIICNFSVREDSRSTVGKHNNEHQIVYRRYVKTKWLVALLSFIDFINRRRTTF